MSMPPENIEPGNTWGFTITKDSENPVLLEFDTFDGTKKHASPSFLMAVLLRKHFKAIEDEIGEKPKEIAFWIYNELNDEEQFDEDEMKRIKKGLKESCKLLNVNCIFIDC
uniref:Uncharacterized protein n=1 Tax=Panagrolaimus davidi TaxID=227884 RepID=A0A914P6J8_9BILA